MKKLSFILTIALVFCLCEIFGQPVSLELAQKIATNHMLSVGLENKLKSAGLQPKIQFTLKQVQVEEHDTLFYILNDSLSSSFVIISADKRVWPILGYGDEGVINANNQSPGFISMLESIKRQIAAVISSNLAPDSFVVNQWTKLSQSTTSNSSTVGSRVGPLIKTKWGQGCYYNLKCPSDSRSDLCGRVPTGCTATSACQILKYFNYPTKGKGSNTYQSRYGTLSANFSESTYRWSEMQNEPSSPSSAISLLMRDVGYALNMDYDYDASGAPLNAAMLVDYFGYSPNIKSVARDNYSYTNWRNMLIAELNSARPIWYRGDDGRTGHAFVIDGFEDQDYVHVNWGWDGQADGFYYLPNLSPDGMDFNSDQAAIIGIEPSSLSNGIDLTITAGTQLVSPSSVQAGSNITVACSLDNSGSSSCGASQVYIFASKDDILNTNDDVFLGYIDFSSIPAKSCTVVKSTSVKIPNSLSGTYYIWFWADGSQAINETVEDNNFASCKLAVTGGTSISNDECNNATSLQIGKTISGSLYGATRSLSENYCGSTQSTAITDVWYSFVATATSHTITSAPSPGLDIVEELFDGCIGNNIACRDNGGGKGKTETLVYNNFIIGRTYFIRIHQDGTKTTDDFTIQVTGGSSTSKPDLIVESASASPNQGLINEQRLTLTINVKDLNGNPYPQSGVNVWMSDNNSLETNEDLNFAWIEINSSQTSSSSRNLNFQLPQGNFQGPMYLILQVDGGQMIDETNETNNTYSLPIKFQGQQVQCSYNVQLSNTNFGYQGGTGKIGIQTESGSGCNWEFDTDCDFITFSQNKGTGPFEISFVVTENPTDHVLEGNIIATGLNGYQATFNITIEPNPGCVPTPSVKSIDVPSSGGHYTFTINNCDIGFWNIYNSCSQMITNLNPKEGIGNQVVSFDVLPNENETSIKCRITVQQSGLSITINQAGKRSNTVDAPVLNNPASVTSSGFSTNFNSVSYATGYKIDLASDAQFSRFVSGYQAKDLGNNTAIAISGLQPNTSYYLRAVAYNALATSSFSNTIVVKTQNNVNDMIISIGSVQGSSGSNVTVPVTANNLTNASAFQGTIIYDSNKLQFAGITNWIVDSKEVILNQLSDRLSFVYSDTEFYVPNGGVFFNLNFTIKPGVEGTATIGWSDTPTAREFSNSLAQEIKATYQNGSVIIQQGQNFSGQFIYANASFTPINNARIVLTNNSNNQFGGTTDANGRFSFNVSSGNYSIKPEMGSKWGGVTAIDLTVVKKAIAGLTQINPFQLRCADVNGSGNLSAVDITLIKQRILGQITQFSGGDMVTDPSTIVVNGSTNQNLQGLWAGDVNASWAVTSLKAAGTSPFISTADAIRIRNGVAQVPLRINANTNIASITMKFSVPDGFILNSVDGFPIANDLSYNVINQDVILVYSTTKPFNINTGDILCTLTFRSSVTNLPNSFYLSGSVEVGDPNDKPIPNFTLFYPSILGSATGIEEEWIEQIKMYPNPASKYVTIANLQEGERIEFIDLVGRKLLSKDANSNLVRIDIHELKTGIYNVKIIKKNGEFAVKKLVVR